jgi:hypothetical protein
MSGKLTAQNIHYTNQQWQDWSDHIDQIEVQWEAIYASASRVQKQRLERDI